jgi:hypothetical protein
MDVQLVRAVLACIEYPEYKLAVTVDGRGEMFLQGSYDEPDIEAPDAGPVRQLTRRWFISPHMTRSEIVQTAFKCVMTSMEHRVREHFKYRGQLVFGPHFNVDDLYALASSTKPEKRE